jgi:Acyltransferase family
MRTLQRFSQSTNTAYFSSAAEPLAGIDEILTTTRQLEVEADSKNPTDYLFVSNVRFLAMISIIWVHTILVWGNATSAISYLQVILLQGMKFGTIGFFLISGYLMGEGLTRTSAQRYFYRRVKVVLVPWLFWGLVWFALELLLHPDIVLGPQGFDGSMRWLLHQYAKFVFFKSIYWFVPNFFLCLALLLWLHAKISDRMQGVIFLAFSVGYGINVYLKLFPEGHTGALLGFVFYMWLGSMAYKHREAWARWIDKVSWTGLMLFTLLTAAFAIGEMHILTRVGSTNEFNTLRLSNQAFSVLVTMMIVKCNGPLFPEAIAVRTETFGLFLLHPILIQVFQFFQDKVPGIAMKGIQANGVVLLVLSLSTFVGIYLLALILTKGIRRIPSLRWTVGR